MELFHIQEQELLEKVLKVINTPSGYILQPEIEIPEGVTSINISSDGIVSVQVPGQLTQRK